MISWKKALVPALAGAFSVISLLVTASAASAYIVCNREGDCWHTDRRLHAPGVVFEYHPDDWYFHQHWDANHHWREMHEGRGYWRNGIWLNF